MSDFETRGHDVINVHPVLLRLPAHLLRADDVIEFPATAIDGTPIPDRHPLAVVIEAKAEDVYLDDGEKLTLTTQGYDGGWYIDYVDPLRMFSVARNNAWHVSPSA